LAVVGLAAGLIGFAAPAAQAAPAWIAPQAVFSTPVTAIQSDPFFVRKSLDVASDSAGNSIAVWIEQHPKVPGPGTECQAIQASRPAGGSFGAPQPLGPAMAFCSGQVKLAMNAGGTAVVAWKQGGEIDASIRQPGGSFSAPVRLDSSSANDDPWVSIDDSGVAAITWDDTAVGGCAGLTPGVNWALHAVIVRPGLGFGGAETVCDAPHPTGPTIFTPRSAVDPQGDVVATWVNSYNDGTNSHDAVESAYRPAGGTFNGATPHVLGESLNPTAPSGSFAADIAVDSQGRATAVWPFFNGTHTVIDTAVRPPGDSSSFASAGGISDPTADSNSPRLAVDPSTNTALATWVQCVSGSCQVEGSTRPSGGGFQVPQALSGPGATTAFGPLVAIDQSGAAVVIWSGPSPDTPGAQVQVSRRLSGTGQSFGAVSTISKDDPSQSPALAFDGEGNAIAVWEHDTKSPAGAILQYAGFDASPPEIRSVSAPNGFAGRPVSLSASVFDRWTAPTVTWSFGDRATATGAAVTHTYKKRGSYKVTITAQDGVGNQSSSTATVKIGCAPHRKGTKLGPDCKKLRARRVKFAVRYHLEGEGHGRAKFVAIVLAKLTSHTKVQIRCIGRHKGCPFKTKKVKRPGSKANLAKLLRHRTLDSGAIVQIRGTLSGAIGRVANLRIKGGSATLRYLCLPPGSKKPKSKCRG
jgi:PKD domain